MNIAIAVQRHFQTKRIFLIGKFRYMSYRVFFSILLTSCFMWSGALDSSDVLLSYSVISLVSLITITLISSLEHKYTLIIYTP